MISVSLAWFVYIVLTPMMLPRLNAESAFIIRNAGFLALCVVVLDALITRLSAAGLPRPEVSTLLYGAGLLFVCEQVGRSSPTHLLATPWLFLLLSLLAGIPRRRRIGRDMFRLHMSKTITVGLYVVLCAASVMAESATVKNGTSIAIEILIAIAVVWFAWRAYLAVGETWAPAGTVKGSVD
jgi:hypothetical protein